MGLVQCIQSDIFRSYWTDETASVGILRANSINLRSIESKLRTVRTYNFTFHCDLRNIQIDRNAVSFLWMSTHCN